MSFREGRRLGMFELQEHTTLKQEAPVQNTWYELLPATELCRVYAAGINVEGANETLQVRITIDGKVSTPLDITCNHSTTYHILRLLDAITQVVTYNGISTVIQAFLCEGKNVKIEVRKTTAAGAGNLTGICVYGVLKVAR